MLQGVVWLSLEQTAILDDFGWVVGLVEDLGLIVEEEEKAENSVFGFVQLLTRVMGRQLKDFAGD